MPHVAFCPTHIPGCSICRDPHDLADDKKNFVCHEVKGSSNEHKIFHIFHKTCLRNYLSAHIANLNFIPNCPACFIPLELLSLFSKEELSEIFDPFIKKRNQNIERIMAAAVLITSSNMYLSETPLLTTILIGCAFVWIQKNETRIHRALKYSDFPVYPIFGMAAAAFNPLFTYAIQSFTSISPSIACLLSSALSISLIWKGVFKISGF